MSSSNDEAKRPNYENGFTSVRTRAKADGLARLATRESFARRLTLTQVDLIETDAKFELADARHPAL